MVVSSRVSCGPTPGATGWPLPLHRSESPGVGRLVPAHTRAGELRPGRRVRCCHVRGDPVVLGGRQERVVLGGGAADEGRDIDAQRPAYADQVVQVGAAMPCQEGEDGHLGDAGHDRDISYGGPPRRHGCADLTCDALGDSVHMNSMR